MSGPVRIGNRGPHRGVGSQIPARSPYCNSTSQPHHQRPLPRPQALQHSSDIAQLRENLQRRKNIYQALNNNQADAVFTTTEDHNQPLIMRVKDKRVFIDSVRKYKSEQGLEVNGVTYHHINGPLIKFILVK